MRTKQILLRIFRKRQNKATRIVLVKLFDLLEILKLRLYDLALNRASIVVLKVYNNLGQEIKEIIRGFRNVGEYKIEFNGKELPSRVYYYRLSVGLSSTTKEMLLLK